MYSQSIDLPVFLSPTKSVVSFVLTKGVKSKLSQGLLHSTIFKLCPLGPPKFWYTNPQFSWLLIFLNRVS